MKRNNLFRKTAACTLAIVMMAAGTLTGCSKPADEPVPTAGPAETPVATEVAKESGAQSEAAKESTGETAGAHTFFCA